MIFKHLYKNHFEQNSNLYLGESTIYKRGVYCDRKIKRGELIEDCPLIIFNHEESELVKNTPLYFYYFIIKNSPQQVALALGMGSIYNHNYPSNAVYSYNERRQSIRIHAATDIIKYTEITINYNGDPNDASEIIFSSSL